MKRQFKFIHFTFNSTFNCNCMPQSIKLFERKKGDLLPPIHRLFVVVLRQVRSDKHVCGSWSV